MGLHMSAQSAQRIAPDQSKLSQSLADLKKDRLRIAHQLMSPAGIGIGSSQLSK
jgi:hypothetical protein